MIAHEARGGIAEELRLQSTEVTLTLRSGAKCEVELLQQGRQALMRSGDALYAVEGTTPVDGARLEELTLGNHPQLATLLRIDPIKGELLLQVRRFPSEIRISEPIQIGVDDKIIDELRSAFRVGGAPAEVLKWLTARLLISPPPGRPDEPLRFILCGTHRGGDEAFRIMGDSIAADVRRVDNCLRVERVVRGGQLTKARLTLAHADIALVDATAAAEMNGSLRTTLSAAVAGATSYLRFWQTYQDIEREQLVSRAQFVGVVEYERAQRTTNGDWRFWVNEQDFDDFCNRCVKLKERSSFELEAGEELPSLSVAEETEPSDKRRRHRQRSFQGTLGALSDTEHFIELVPDEEDDALTPPPESGYIFLATSGDRARLDRRKRAEEALRTGTCPMPQLGLLLEGRPAPASRRSRISTRSRKLKPVLRECFGTTGPTQRQREAIEIALNTPDICLIQGPPGTGKTKVITAIEQCLAVLADEGIEPSHRILVSAAQHDAVENVAARSEVFGLPAMKVGKRRKGAGSGRDFASEFAKEKVQGLQANRVVRSETEQLTKARRLVIAATRFEATATEQAQQIRDILRHLDNLVEPAVRDRLLRHAASITAPVTAGDPEETEQALRAARGIRVDASTFSDDGPLRASIALKRLEGLLSETEKVFLVQCAAASPGEVPSVVQQGAALRNALIDRLSQPRSTEEAHTNITTQTLLLGLLDHVQERLSATAHGVDAAIAAYMDELETDPTAVREALEYYTVVLASTLQHAAGKQMKRVRGIDDGSPTFESVIVDEAARANPLDLFIPLSMANRRVVLVGDHRQLPHLLEPDVEAHIEKSVEAGTLAQETLDAVSESLFQRMWHLLKDMEQQDEITRTVTLDAQFRMHPTLGAFVSAEFYEVHKEVRIDSPRHADDFRHSLPGYENAGSPVVAAWLDVPSSQGRERSGASKSRTAEAKAIASEIERLIHHDPRLTFGVISFYAAQVEEIFLQLSRVGLAERVSRNSTWRIVERWATTLNEDGRSVERLRIGTVDAFQGMEFDVVFLSTVRSNELRGATDLERRKKYGHLMLENRLCVAMSRQKRLLIAVGDLEFMRKPSAREAMRALFSFTELCRETHGKVR